MKKIVYMFFICIIASCAVREYAAGDVQEEGFAEILFSTDIVGRESVKVKSILSDDIEDKITDVTLASYDSDGVLTDTRYYGEDLTSMALIVRNGCLSNVYALVNMGDMTKAFPAYEESVPDMGYDVQSYQDVENSGFPMSGRIEGFSSLNPHGVVPVERLFSKICVRVLHKGLSGFLPSSQYAYNMCNRSMFVRQANRHLLPFSAEGSRAMSRSDVMMTGDYHNDMNDREAYNGSLTMAQLGPGPGYFQDTTFVFYVPENVQGVLLPSNNDPFGKVYENISDVGGKSYSDLCTYLEFNASREATIGYSGSVTYRYYLGADNVSDFSLERNKRYDLTLDFTENGFHVESWKVTRGDDWTDTRVLEFLEEPYILHPGGTLKVMAHYSQVNNPLSDSYLLPDEWHFVTDGSAMKNAGLSYTFDPGVLETGRNGYDDFCINVSASVSAKVGTSIPIMLVSRDGALYDESYIHVVESEEFSAVLTDSLEYVGQESILSVVGADESDLPLYVTFSNALKVSSYRQSDDTFKIVALRSGNVTVTIRNAAGTKARNLKFNFKTPVLEVEDKHISLSADGEAAYADYRYVDHSGNPLVGLNELVFNTFLRPVVETEGYFNSYVSPYDMRFEIAKLQNAGKSITLGGTYSAKVSAVNCTEVAPSEISLSVKNPFPSVQAGSLGKIDDYTLFAASDVDAELRSNFSDEIASNASFTYKGFVPDAAKEYVSVALEPRWYGDFSADNGIYDASLNFADGMVTVRQNAKVYSSGHSAGKHDLMIYVTNRHSSEKIGCSCGTVDVYVHTAIGARALFGSQAAGYNPYGNETFASVYNSLAGHQVYPENVFGNAIHYMDVKVEWLTDVSKVQVFKMMDSGIQSGISRYDAGEMIRPSVSDGQVASNTRMLYSVCRTRDSRISVCNESYRPVNGIGTVIYRALLVPTYSQMLSNSELRVLFFGCQPLSNKGSVAYAPCFDIYDVNAGRTVPSGSPYYFAPSSLQEQVDDSGRGYHVIHSLKDISPDTYGWINLL